MNELATNTRGQDRSQREERKLNYGYVVSEERKMREREIQPRERERERER